MQRLLKTFIRLRGKSATRRLNAAAAWPDVVQRDFLLELLHKNAETAFGRDHDFVNIRTEADFRRQVPIQDFEGFRPYVSRIMAGEKRFSPSAKDCTSFGRTPVVVVSP